MLLSEASNLLSPHLESSGLKHLLTTNARLEKLRQNIKKSIGRINKKIGKGPVKVSPETEKACKEFAMICEQSLKRD